MAIMSFTIDKVPDLTLNKYQDLSDSGVEGLLNRHSSFLRQWHGIAITAGASVHLMYCFEHNACVGKRLKMYLMLQASEDILVHLKPLLLKSPLSDYYELVECEAPKMFFKAGTTLVKNERVAELYNPLANKSQHVHFVPHIEANQEGRLYDLFRIMETVGNAEIYASDCAYRIDLYPVSEIQTTISKFSPVIKALQGDNDIKIINDSANTRGDNYSASVRKEYEEWMSNVETTPHFRVNIFSFAENAFLSKIILNAAASEAISEGNFSIAPIKSDETGIYNCMSRMERGPESFCFYPQNAVLDSWSTTFLLEEVEPFFRFPVLYDGENIELPKETAPAYIENGIHIGVDENGYDVKFPVEDLSRHAFFTGVPGAGKTNTMLHLATELKKNGIPFLVMEPAKKEYRELLCNDMMDDVYLFSPHLQSLFPLHMNPFEFPKGVRLSEHINALLEVFQGSFVLEGPTYKFLSDAIEKSYTQLGWDIEDINEADSELEYPTIESIYNNLEKAIESSSYDSEIKGNVKAFLQVRLGGLMTRDAGELFNVSVSTLKPEEWLKKSAIVELEVLGEQAKNFFVLLVCHYILETLRVNPNEGKDSIGGIIKPIRHAIFIEEAHNIIAPTAQQSSSDSIDPKISATAYIVKMLAEVRALREAIIIADQLPTALASEVTKNTGLKLVHRLTAQDDREQICSTISASAMQMEQVASFTKGKALMYHEKTLKPFQVQVCEWKKPSIQYNYADDRSLYENIIQRKAVRGTIICTMKNFKVKYMYPLQQIVSDMQRRRGDILGDDKVAMTMFKADKLLVLARCEEVLKKFARLQSLYNVRKYFDSDEDVKGIISYIDSSIDLVKDILNLLKID